MTQTILAAACGALIALCAVGLAHTVRECWQTFRRPRTWQHRQAANAAMTARALRLRREGKTYRDIYPDGAG